MQYNFTIRKKDKGYQIIVSYKDGYKWKQKSKQGFATQRDAKLYGQEIVDNLKKTITSPLDDSLKNVTLIELFELYINEKIDITYNTTIAYRNALNVVSALFDKPIPQITKHQIMQEYNNSSYSVQTINLCSRVLKTVFNYAIDPYHIIRNNPCISLKPIKERKVKDLKVFTEIELNDLERMKEKHYMYYVMFMVARYTGARYGEIIAINWCDIDLENQVILIDKQWTRLRDNSYGYAFTKSKNSIRKIPIPPVLCNILENYKTHSMQDRLFPFKDNRSSRANTVLNYYVKDKSMHSFRHTYATTLLSNNVDIKTVASLLGDTVDTVINNYIHYTDEMRKKAAEKVVNIFG